MEFAQRPSDSHSTSSDVYRRRNLVYMKIKYGNLSAIEKQVYIENITKNKKVRIPNTKEQSSQVVWLLKAQMIPFELEGSILYEPVCSELHELPKMSNCKFCGAMKFQFEPPTFCCDNGKIKLAPIEVPNELYQLLTSDAAEAVNFRKNIRLFNNIFSFISFGVKLDKELASARRGVYTFRAQGMVYHDLPGLIPKESGPGYFQLYFVEIENEVQNRMRILEKSPLSEETVKKLIQVLAVNPYAKIFRRLEDYLKAFINRMKEMFY